MQSLLQTKAKHFIYPDGIVTSEFPAVQQKAARYGITFDPWQAELGMYLLGKRKNGLYAAGISGAVMSVPRQVGKTYTVGMIIIFLCILHPKTKVVWTAHRTRTSAETFRNMKSLAQNTKGLSKYIPTTRSANGQEELTFSNGSRILFGAREQGFGRGFDDVSMIIFDEAQILSIKALEDILPTMSAAKNPLAFYMGTPPRPIDPGEVFRDKRTALLKGTDRDGLYVEFSADRNCSLDDRNEWIKANPSYPTRTSESALLRLRRQLSEDSFRREVLGIWDELALATSAISDKQWQAATISNRIEGGVKAYGVEIPPSRDRLTLSACMKYSDGYAHIEFLESHPLTEGTDWLIDFLAERKRNMLGVGIDAGSATGILLQDFADAHIPTISLTMRDVGQACGRFMDMLAAGKLTHLPDEDQPALAAAVKGASTRPLGKSGLFAWGKLGDDVDTTPLVSCTMALHAAFVSKRHPGRKQRLLV